MRKRYIKCSPLFYIHFESPSVPLDVLLHIFTFTTGILLYHNSVVIIIKEISGRENYSIDPYLYQNYDHMKRFNFIFIFLVLDNALLYNKLL